ncbi:MAG: AsnC family transcriptional regulator [Euryarchaeota archaeon RBG_16_68_12]|nr:MAG: AsnC family transcriptional regulator [Euryarchaeota archaeon RBG_16_68_12]
MAKLLDELDTRILRRLNENARQSFRDIARALRVSISTVSNRVKRLEGEGVVLGYAPILDEKKLGYDLLAVIGIRISKGKLLEVQRKIARDDKVVEVYDVTGEYDSMIIARFRNTRELDAFIKRLVAMENVERTYTQVVLNVVKREKRSPL